MPSRLHILTKAPDETVSRLLAIQRAEESGDHRVVIADLTVPEPDYAGLVQRVFEADSIATW